MWVAYVDKSKRALSKPDFEKVRDGLQAAVLECTDTQLKFSGCQLSGGLALIKCGDQTTRIWAEAKVGGILGGLFVGLGTDDLPTWVEAGAERPKLVKLRCFVTGPPPTSEAFFRSIGLQNGIVTSEWRWLTSRTTWRGDGHTIFFRVPETCLSGLRERKMGLYYGLGRISFQEETSAPGTRRVIIGGAASEPPVNREGTQGGEASQPPVPRQPNINLN
jgi:hypothetical protein